MNLKTWTEIAQIPNLDFLMRFQPCISKTKKCSLTLGIFQNCFNFLIVMIVTCSSCLGVEHSITVVAMIDSNLLHGVAGVPLQNSR
jgi:uncharacterized UBP type Zn finger protein